MEYSDRLKKLKMPTLKYRRLRGDMIETFKIITVIYDNEVAEGIFDLDPNTRTRGHSKKIKKKFCKINLRKFSFTNRISCCLYGDQTAAAYSRCGLTSA
jgi:hypothetical protein